MGAGEDMGSVSGASVVTAVRVCVPVNFKLAKGEQRLKNNNVHLSCAHQRPEHSHHTY